jgi:hypothetical protein
MLAFDETVTLTRPSPTGNSPVNLDYGIVNIQMLIPYGNRERKFPAVITPFRSGYSDYVAVHYRQRPNYLGIA